ncbi:MAG: hypothetical protein MAG795_00877 [Candidatus Woesearchaeota archaeon]|nr:hypothetical protein [Candidatus Woesearchaeota archaeon]
MNNIPKKVRNTLCAILVTTIASGCGLAARVLPEQTTDTPTYTETPSPTPSPTFTPTFTPTMTLTPSLTPTDTPTHTQTFTPTPTEVVVESDLIEYTNYDPHTLEIIEVEDDVRGDYFSLVDGSGTVVVRYLDNMYDAEQAFQLARMYTQMGFLGQRGDQFQIQIWQKRSGLEGELDDRDCWWYNSTNLWYEYIPDHDVYAIYTDQLYEVSEGEDELGSGGIRYLKKESEAKLAVEEIYPNHNYICFIGRSNERSNVHDFLVTYQRTENNISK